MNGLINLLMSRGMGDAGYVLLGVNSVFVVNQDMPYIISVMDYNKLPEQGEEIFKVIDTKVNEKFIELGYRNYKHLKIVFTNQLEETRNVLANSQYVWFVNNSSNELIVEKNQPIDYLGLRPFIVEYLKNREIEQEERKKLSVDYKKIFTITNILVFVNLAIFIVCEKFFDGNLNVIHKFGGLGVPEVIGDGEWYRLFTSFFLHFDAQHVGSNSIGLFFVGNTIEKKLGKFKICLVYFGGGIFASVVTLVNYLLLGLDNNISAGASGAVYALLGSFIALLVMEGRKKKHEEVVVDLIRFGIVLFFMFANDTMKGGINVVAHASGFGFGLAITFLMNFFCGKKSVIK